MALLFIDGFDHYASADLTKKGWITGAFAPTIDSTAGRRGGGALKGVSNSYTAMCPLAAAPQTAIIGFAHKIGGLGTTATFLEWGHAGGTHGTIVINNDGSIGARRGSVGSGTVLGTTAAGVVSVNTWAYWEFKIKVHDSTGTVDILKNGVSVLSLSGLDTNNGGTDTITYLSVYPCQVSGGLSGLIDDLYVLDTTGSAPQNTYLGDCRIDTVYPNGDGAASSWTCSTGSTHYTLVDETTPNESDYVESSTPAQQDLYDFTNMSVATGTIFGVQLNLCAQKDDSGARSIKPLCRVSSTTYQGSAQSLNTSYYYHRQIYEQNPNTAAAWSESGVNAAQFGIECV